MSIHTLTPGSFTPERIAEIARLGQQDPVVRGYRSFHSLTEGRIVWVLEAPSRDAIVAWCQKVGLPLDGVTELEMEGFVGTIRPARMGIPNQLNATVDEVADDGILALVTLRFPSGQLLRAMIDSEARAELKLTPGSPAVALFRANDVSLSKGDSAMKLSFPNQIKGKVTHILSSTTLVIIHIDTPAGQIVSAMIPSAAEQIELKVGDEVTALFKALDVSLAKG